MTEKQNVITITVTLKTSLPLDKFEDADGMKSDVIEALDLPNDKYFSSYDVDVVIDDNLNKR